MSLEIKNLEEISWMDEAEHDSYRYESALADGSGLEVPVFTRTQLGQFRDQIRALESRLIEVEGERDALRAKCARAISKLDELGCIK